MIHDSEYQIANDNAASSRLDQLIEVTIEDFAIRAESDVEEGEEPIAAGPALMELAARAMADVVLETQFYPKEVITMVTGRLSNMLLTELDRSNAGRSPQLLIVRE